MAKMLCQAITLLLLTVTMAAVVEMNTDLNANGAFADLLTVRISYFRSLCDANPVTWDQGLADIANSTIWSCNLQYDYFSPQGQIIFQMVGDHGQVVNSPNATSFAPSHWYDMRVNVSLLGKPIASQLEYTDIQSDEYDQLEPFVPAWEFTQMVWKANTKIGCAYAADVACPNPDTSQTMLMYQLYCLFTPGGNKWDQWGAQVECKDCTGVEPQTSTVDLSTITWPDQKRGLPRQIATPKPPPPPPNEYVRASLSAAMNRVEKYLTMNNEDFMARWDLPKAEFQTTTTATP